MKILFESYNIPKGNYVPEVQLSEREALLSALGIRFLYQCKSRCSLCMQYEYDCMPNLGSDLRLLYYS